MESFLLILTLCGTLNNGKPACEEFVIDSNQTRVDCLESIATVYNQEKTKLCDLMGDAGNDWFKTVTVTKLHCVAENKE